MNDSDMWEAMRKNLIVFIGILSILYTLKNYEVTATSLAPRSSDPVFAGYIPRDQAQPHPAPNSSFTATNRMEEKWQQVPHKTNKPALKLLMVGGHAPTNPILPHA